MSELPTGPQDCAACGGPVWATDETCEWCLAPTPWAEAARQAQAERNARYGGGVETQG